MSGDMYRAAVLRKAILAELSAADDEARDDLRADLNPGDKRAVWDGGTKLGYVQMTEPKGSWTVIDWAAFGRWVEENVPDAIVVTQAINQVWQARVLRTGKAEVVDPETGEVREVTPAGVVLSTPAPQLRVAPTDECKARAVAILRGTPALGASDE